MCLLFFIALQLVNRNVFLFLNASRNSNYDELTRCYRVLWNLLLINLITINFPIMQSMELKMIVEYIIADGQVWVFVASKWAW